MNPRLLRMIIVLMFLAMTGLVGIQIYWIREAVEQREQQFKQGVYEAMSSVVFEYEKYRVQKDFERMFDWASFETQLQKQLDSLGKGNDSKVRRNKDGKIEEITINVKKPGLTNGKIWYSTRSYDGSIENNAIVDPFGLDGREGGQHFFSELGPEEGVEEPYGNQTMEMISSNEDMIGMIFREMLTGYIAGSTSPIDSLVLDSIIRQELQDKGIDIHYDFGVFNPYQDKFMVLRSDKSDKLKHSAFRLSMAVNPFMEENELMLFFPHKTQYLLRNIWFLLLASAFLIVIIIFSFAYTINTIFRQKKVQEIKNDLINNITHELKTPISTISLACQAMNDPDLANSPLRNNYVQMIDDENKRLGLLVENVLQSAVYDKGDFKLKIKKVDMHARIDRAISGLSIQAKSKGIHIIRELNATEPVIEADEVMMTNLVFNLVDNAIKYYKPGDPFIRITTYNDEDNLVLEVADNGIGISKDNQKRIFEKLYRVPTGNVHNVKGYGLGLSYVKSIVERHGGEIMVDSVVGEGSNFKITLPVQQHIFD